MRNLKIGSLICLLLLTTITLNAQNIGINATGLAPAASAGLDVDFTNKGFLAPRVALTATNVAGPIAGPATSLLVYNTATAGVAPNNVTPGYYYWGGAAWIRLTTGGVTSSCGTVNYVPKMTTASTIGCSQIFDDGTNVGIGTVAPIYKFHTIGDIYADGGWFRVSGNQGLYFQSWGGGFYMTDGTWIRTYGNKNFYHNTGIMRTDGTFQVANNGGRFLVQTNGQTSVNNTAPAAGDLLSSTAFAGNEWAINGYNTLAIGSGVYANNTNAANIYSAIEGSQSGASAGGGGVYGIGNTLGTIGKANSTTAQAFGVQGDNDGIWAALGGWQSGPWTARKVYGLGTVSTIIDGLNEGEKVTMSAPESPDILFMDFGIGQLNNGKIHVSIDPIFTKNIHVDTEHPIKIFVQLEGECNGVYVTNKSALGFDVIELNGGTSNVSFSYSITANRANEVFTYSDGTTKISDNINSRYHPVDMTFFKEQSSREGHKGRSLIKSRSLQMNNDGK